MPKTSKGLVDDLRDVTADFYATHSYDEPPKDFMEQTSDTPNDDEREVDTSAKRRMALLAWERRALSSLARFAQADCRHQDAAISKEEQDEIRAALVTCTTAAAVRSVFAQAAESLEDLFPPTYHTSAQAWERQQIAAKWAARVKAEREA